MEFFFGGVGWWEGGATPLLPSPTPMAGPQAPHQLNPALELTVLVFSRPNRSDHDDRQVFNRGYMLLHAVQPRQVNFVQLLLAILIESSLPQ